MQEADLVKTVEELQKTVAALEARTNDLTFKAQITSKLFGRVGLDRFFGEPEFWENITDVGQFECSERCIESLQTENAAIAANTTYTDEERQAKYVDAAKRASECHQQCQQAFPSFP